MYGTTVQRETLTEETGGELQGRWHLAKYTLVNLYSYLRCYEQLPGKTLANS